MTLEELKKEKSTKLILLEIAKRKNERRLSFQLGSEVAALEGFIIRHYLDRQDYDNAVISLVSQASCLCDSNRNSEAMRVFFKALEYCQKNDLSSWIRSEIRKLPSAEVRKLPFISTNVSIEQNEELRIPQKEAYLSAKRYFSNKSGHAIIQLPVGCGKTGAMAILPFSISKGRVLAIAPNLEIRKNLYDNFNSTSESNFLRKTKVVEKDFPGPTCAYLDSAASIHDCDSADIVVANIHQLAEKSSKMWLDMLAPDFFDMILIDEAHHNVASTWQKALERFPDAKKISFTATPLRSDGKEVDGERIYRFPISQAIKDGYIKDIASRTLEPKEIHFTYKDSPHKIGIEEVLKLRENSWFSKGVALSRECNVSIVDASIQAMNELRESGELHQIIAVACSIDHAKSIRGLYEERHLKADIIHSELETHEQEDVLSRLKAKQLDVIVQVQMLGEGADYPHLSVAAIFRPYRHLMPYVQFVGRVMRVLKQNKPGHLANRGFVISHVGLNVDRWWQELKDFDKDDEVFFRDLALGQQEFMLVQEKDPEPFRRKFKPDMNVIEEAIAHFIQDHFVPEDAKLVIDDLIETMSMRGLNIEALGLTREELEKKVLQTYTESRKKGKLKRLQVSPQEARKVARKRLDERVGLAAKQLLNELKIRVGGFDLPKLFPATATSANLPAAIVLINRAVLEYLKVGPRERDLLTEEQLVKAHDNIDEIIDKVSTDVKSKIKEKFDGKA